MTAPTDPRPGRPEQRLPSTTGMPPPPDVHAAAGWQVQPPPPPPALAPALDGFGLPTNDPRPPATWTWWEAVLIFFLGLVLAGVVAVALDAVLPRGQAFFWVGILGEFLPVMVLAGWLQLFHKGWMKAIGFPKRVWREIWAGILGGLMVFLIAGVGIAKILTAVFDRILGGSVQTPQQIPDRLSAAEILLAIGLAIVSAPIAEELFFRGMLFRAMRSKHSYWTAAIGSSLLFGLAHLQPDERSGTGGALLLVAMMFFVGFGLSYVYERRGNIVSSMAAHATFNTIGLILIIGMSR